MAGLTFAESADDADDADDRTLASSDTGSFGMTVMQIMRVGRLAPRDREPSDAASGPGRSEHGRLVWTDERPDPNRFVVYAVREGADPGQRIVLVFERLCFARWRLVELRLAAAP